MNGPCIKHGYFRDCPICVNAALMQENEQLHDELSDKKAHIEGLKLARDRAIEAHEADITETYERIWAKDEEIEQLKQENEKLIHDLSVETLLFELNDRKIQEQKIEIEQLKAQNAALKAENAVLREFITGTSNFARECIAKLGGERDE